jgi:hypothetical protein
VLMPSDDHSRREYRIKPLHRGIPIFIFAIVLTLFALSGLHGVHDTGSLFALGGFLMFLCIVLVWPALRSRLVLEGSRIEARSGFRTVSADRSEIEGTRRMRDRYRQWTQVYLKQNRGSFRVSDSFDCRNDLLHWLEGVPDLDQVEADKITRQLESDSLPGEAEADARDRLAQAKRVVIGLAVVEVLAAIAVLARYAPVQDASLVLVLLMPPAGIWLLLRNPLLYTIFKRKPDPRVGVGILVLAPGFLFFPFFKADQGVAQFLDPGPLFQLGFVVFAIYLALLIRFAWKTPTKFGSILSLILCGAFYSAGVARTVDTLPDRSAARSYQSVIANMHTVRGKSTSYYLTLGEWGPPGYRGDVEVSPHFYGSMRIGDTVCTSLHGGFLHAPWYTLSQCPNYDQH